MRILITGAAGFIGSALAEKLASRGDDVTGVDNLNNYYDTRLKYARLDRIKKGGHGILFEELSICDREGMDEIFRKGAFDAVVNLAAQAGVRYSITNPYSYLESNLAGFLTVLECCRNHGVKNLLFASSSSVYGLNRKVPYSESDMTDSPVSLYAATKKSNELMAHAYSRLYGINMAGLRYFTVYGPWGRPDMAPMLFARAIVHGEKIKVFNGGDMLRDFTYIDDIVEGTVRLLDTLVGSGKSGKDAGFAVYNIGCSSPVRLMDFISELEDALGKTAEKVFLPMQPGDVYETYADVSRLEKDTGYKPGVTLRQGIRKFAEWYLSEDNPME